MAEMTTMNGVTEPTEPPPAPEPEKLVKVNRKAKKAAPEAKAAPAKTKEEGGSIKTLLLDPKEVVLISDKDHKLYDPRLDLPPYEWLVLDIMSVGVLQNITVRKNGSKYECVAGRQRVLAAREANKRLKGKATVRVPAMLQRGDDAKMFGIMLSENSLRRNDDPIAEAKKIQRFIEMGKTEKEAGEKAGMSLANVRLRLQLLDCHKDVLKAVTAGKIGATMAAREFSKIPRDEQPEALEKFLASGNTKGEQGKKNARALREGGEAKKKGPKSRPAKVIGKAVKILMKVGGRDTEVAVAAMKWAMGMDNSFGAYPKIEEVLFPEDEEGEE